MCTILAFSFLAWNFKLGANYGVVVMVFVQIPFDNVDIGSIERRGILKLYQVFRRLDENKE